MSRDRGVPCPRCGGDDRFAVNERKNVFICRGGDGGRDVGGDAIALAQHLDGTDFLVACETVTGEMVLLSPAVDKQPLALPHKLAAPEDDSARLARARRLWGESVGPRETLVEKYLAPRLVALTDDIAGSVLRFHGAVPWREANETIIRVPAMLAVYRHILSDEIVGVQVTRLSPAGEKIDRRMRGCCGDGAIKFDCDAHVTVGLTIAEGAETSLTGRQLGLRPAWALGSVGAIAKFPVLAGIEALTILAEAGTPSARACEACASRWHAAGREVGIVEPLAGSDLNDAIQELA